MICTALPIAIMKIIARSQAVKAIVVAETTSKPIVE